MPERELSHPDTITLDSFDEPLLLYQSPLLAGSENRIRHGFSGRCISFGGPETSAEAARVAREALCRAMGDDPARLAVPGQTHSAHIAVNTDVIAAGGFCGDTDALIVFGPDSPALVQTADCVPLILYDPVAHVGAVIHAGWRGTAQGITTRAVARLRDEFRVNPATLLAAIGPAIGACCYEVSEDVIAAVAKTVDAPREAFVTRPAEKGPHLDLKAVNALQLRAAGVSRIDILPDCTRCAAERLFSHRRGEAGRQVAYLSLLPQ